MVVVMMAHNSQFVGQLVTESVSVSPSGIGFQGES